MCIGDQKPNGLDDQRYSGKKIRKSISGSTNGLIYINPEGPNGNPDPVLAAKKTSVKPLEEWE